MRPSRDRGRKAEARPSRGRQLPRQSQDETGGKTASRRSRGKAAASRTTSLDNIKLHGVDGDCLQTPVVFISFYLILSHRPCVNTLKGLTFSITQAACSEGSLGFWCDSWTINLAKQIRFRKQSTLISSFLKNNSFFIILVLFQFGISFFMLDF